MSKPRPLPVACRNNAPSCPLGLGGCGACPSLTAKGRGNRVMAIFELPATRGSALVCFATRGKKMNRLHLGIALIVFNFITPVASADCATLPTGSALIKMAGSQTGMFGSTAAGPFPEGSLAYDAAQKSPVYCDGTNWLKLAAASATTGSGTVAMCAPTLTKYTGDLGGISGANAKCASEFGSGWTFAYYFKPAIVYPQSAPAYISDAWVQTTGTEYSSFNCGNWTSNQNGLYGTSLSISSGTYSINNPYSTYCYAQRNILCCNF